MKKNSRVIPLVAAISATLIASCSANREVIKPVAECWTGGPTWTCMNVGRCALPEFPDSLCAVGRTERIQSESLAVDVAAVRAKGQIGAFVLDQVERYARAQQTSLGHGDGETASQLVNRVDQAIANAAQSGVRTPNSYFNRESGTYYVLAEVDAGTLRKSGNGLQWQKGLGEAEKQEVMRLYEGAIGEFERERERAQAR